MPRFTAEITLTILGPFLTAATGPEQYGRDKSFQRDVQGRLVIPSSHIKGRLRMALEELLPSFPEGSAPHLGELLGREIVEDRYSPAPGALKFSDLRCDSSPQEASRTRTAIDPRTLTAQEHFLREFEDPFASGTETRWSGDVSYFAADADEAQAITRMLHTGFRWLTNLGAEKGVGFGRLRAVAVSAPVADETPKAVAMGAGPALHLRITPLEPILVGGIKNRRTNYVESRLELSGGLVKGALATALNRAHGVRPVYRKLGATFAGDFPDYPNLVTHFAAIRVSHALPVPKDGQRPVRLPLSTVEIDGEMRDTALAYPQSTPFVAGAGAPVYAVDWKTPRAYWGAAQPQMVAVTRSAVEDISQRTLEGQLFTYAYCAPVDKDDGPVEWVCDVDFSGIGDESARLAAKEEFVDASGRYLRTLGKTGRSVSVQVNDGKLCAVKESKGLIVDGLVILTLQSDALMLSPDPVRSLSPGDDLHALYTMFWAEASGGGASASLELMDFYAHQGFEGGYLYHRYLGSAERHQKPFNYQPYYLTRAGSVFILRVVDEAKARLHVARWVQNGLPLPAWAEAKYGQFDRETWENCPFVAQNGYGEVSVNLHWHWDKQI